MGNAIETAIKMETDAIAFYGEAMKKCAHSYGKKMFEVMIKEEEVHLKLLKEFFTVAEIARRATSFREEVKTIFETMKPAMMDRVEASEDELEALKIGMEMEGEGKKYYDERVAATEDPKEKALFQRLSADEAEHYRIFADSYSFLKDSADWNLWEERAIYEG